MNASSFPAVLLVLAISGVWLLGRRRTRPFLRSTDTSDVVALNRAQIERVRLVPSPDVAAEPDPRELSSAPAPDAADAPRTASLTSLPRSRRLEHRRLIQLQGWLLGSREQRLDAVAIAASCGHASVLPLLRRALRDPDPAVMAAAAAAIARFRYHSAALIPSSTAPASRLSGRAQAGVVAAATLPRRVSRTR